MFGFLTKTRPARINPSEAVARVKAGTLTLIDVREAGELRQTGKARGALHIPLGQIGAQTDPASGHFNRNLDTGKAVALYCASGARSARAADVMRANGFTEVHNLGTLHDWQLSGGAMVR
ncbi:rhodanese-like domain-containing protein [Roseibaca sp. V10]|uniref:Rhodanese-like domain-containing protein n=1 Tax=Roseinatronobacter domitianus TaxID=2940293 RepID=A0ABT0M0N4_9RHOB|nr:rhodanese-like domain-containing protein [Roseibaca domitiana]MCL1628432.1 rhodanese-like domain-containing protein [Roseibaca domitiana]